MQIENCCSSPCLIKLLLAAIVQKFDHHNQCICRVHYEQGAEDIVYTDEENKQLLHTDEEDVVNCVTACIVL